MSDANLPSAGPAAGFLAPGDRPAHDAMDRGGEPAPVRDLRVAVVGLGRAGVAHSVMLASLEGCGLVGVADPRRAARAGLRGMGFAAPGFPRVERLLEKVRPDAMIVCAAQDERAGVARAAIDAGVPLLIERPMSRTLAEAEELVELAAARGVPLAVGHPLVYEPLFGRVLDIVRRETLGPLRSARSAMFVSRVFGPHPRRGPDCLDPRRLAGGVVAHLASDLLFLLVQLFGAPAAVRATWNLLYGEVEDELHGMMTLPGGLEVGFDSSWSVPGYPHASTVLELEGRDGKLLASDEAIELELRRPTPGYPTGETFVRNAEIAAPARFDYGGEALWLHDAAFLRWVAGGAAPPNTGAEALRAHRVMDALYRSAAAGGRAVELS
ncbi:MAG TPA: Gfo/Idh/MocA family oxidoreductase [Terriglobales bacterium]|nr:Gfo/Idh/MocA family oxidoreductase [Terriglobales bacterium]